jgi:hypothetical protein
LLTSPLAAHGGRSHASKRLPIADAHVHLVDFLQNGDFLEAGKLVSSAPPRTLASGQRGKRLEAILYAMDRAGVSHAMVSGMPFVKKWAEDESFRSGYYLDSSSHVVRARDTDYLVALAVQDYRAAKGAAAEKQLARLFPFISGFDGTDLGAVDMLVKRIKEFPGVFKGIGEVMSRHDDLTNLTTGERPRANHPALFRIYDFAGQRGLPVSVHHNMAPISRDKRTKPPLCLQEIVDAFESFPKTNFIWCHAGVSRRINIKDLPRVIDGVLAKHKHHVFIDLSWVVFDDYISRNMTRWARLMDKYPKNFMLGSDIVGKFAGYAKEIGRCRPLLAKLGSRKIRENVAWRNFLRVVPKKGATLPASYHYPERRYTKRVPPRP